MFVKSPLTIAEVHEIRMFHDEGWTRIRGNSAALAAMYGIAVCTLWSIGGRHHYRNLPERWRISRMR